MNTAAPPDRLTRRRPAREHPGESAAQNNVVKKIKTTEDYEDHIVKVICEMVDGNTSLLSVLLRITRWSVWYAPGGILSSC
jgi:hypothetical protein